MEGMKPLWEEGVNIMDVSLKKKFTLKTTIFVQISDYPGLFSPVSADQREDRSLICLDGTYYACLPHGIQQDGVYEAQAIPRQWVHVSISCDE